MQMNDFAKQAEINQFLMLHSMKSCNQVASNKAREDDSVFGGVWVSPEDDVKKNTLSLTGTEIWGPRPNQINEKSISSDSSSIKSTPADITPEVISDKERFFFKNNNAIPYFQFPHGLNHSQNDQRMQQLFGDISHNYNQSNNVPPLQLHQQQQFRSDILPSGEDKFRSILDGKSSGSSSGRVSVSDQDSAIWGNYAQTLNDLNKKSNKNSSSDASQKDFSSPINYLVDFPPTASIIQKDLLEKSFSSNMTTPWSTVVKQSIANNQEDWLNKMKINSNNNFPGSNPVAKMMSKDNLGPFHNSPWDQPSKPHLSQQSTNVWGLPLSQPTTINKHPGSNPTNIWGHSITKDLNIGSQCPVKFDPSVPPPPFPQKTLPLNKNILDGKMPQMNSNNNTTNVNRDQLLSLLGRPLSSMSSSSMKQVGGLNNSREHQNSMQATYLQQQQQANNIFKHLNQQSFNMAATHQVTPMQRPSDLQWSELYKKLARYICSSAQLPQTRSRMIQFFTALGFKKETAGKLLIDNGLDFELTLGELIFKSAVSRGLIDTSLLSPGRSPLDPSKPINSNKHGGILQNYLISLHGIIQQMSFTQNCHDVSASAQPPIDYTIQALINSQERFTSPTLYMPNFSFTSNNYNNDQLVCGSAGGSSSLSSGVINNLKNLISSNNSASSSITGISNDSSNVRSILLSSSNNVKGNSDLNLGLGSNNNNRGMPPSFFTTPPHLGLSSPLPIFDVNCNNEQQQQQQQLLPLLHQQQSKSSSMLNPRSPEWVPNSNSMLDSVGLVSGFGGNANSSIILSTSSATFVSSV
ncbi:hypothetical protein HELRODRAFT_188414, partial [Helobdella robusta]|uniref:UBA domain-containing protein n=1 Tax=Helobdella robusta TaxID=6412 RepID=T1FPY9_HELRO